MATRQLVDSKFRPCSLGCGRTEWGERARVCDRCRAFLAEVAARNRRARRPASDARVSPVYARGHSLSATLATFRRGA
jgi:hypothetical protein